MTVVGMPASTVVVPAADTWQKRFRRLLPFWSVMALALAFCALLPERNDNRWLLLATVGTFVVASLLLFAVPFQRLPSQARLIATAVTCGLVFMLRDATGGTQSGLLPLLFLPVVFEAVYGRVKHIIAAVCMVGFTAALPIVLYGGSRYPAVAWRSALVDTVIAASLGLVVHTLVQQLLRSERALARIGDVSRAMTEDAGEDVRHAICRACTEVVGADTALVMELHGDDLVVTGCVGSDLRVPYVVPEDQQRTGRQAMSENRPVLLPDTRREPGFDADLQRRFNMRGLWHQPLLRGEEVIGLLTLGWLDVKRSLDRTEQKSIELLAAETATALHRADLVGRLSDMARLDSLTGLVNRRAWDEHLEREIQRARRTAQPLSLVLLDLDRFKDYNDAHGHLAGDRLLEAAATAWSREMRPMDLLARWGGEEFAALLPDTTGPAALQVVKRLVRCMPDGQTFSAGVAELVIERCPPMDGEALTALADQAVYRAKDAGRNCVRLASPPVPPPVLPPAGRTVREWPVPARSSTPAR